MSEYEFILDPPPPIPREFVRKAYFFGQMLDCGAEPSDPEWADRTANARHIVYNQYIQSQDGSAFSETFVRHITQKDNDPFTINPTASRLADLVSEGADAMDMFDFMLAVRSYGILAAKTGFSERQAERVNVLSRAYFEAVIEHVASASLKGEAILNLQSLYGHVFGTLDHPDVQHFLERMFLEAQLKVRDNLTLSEMIVESALFGPDTPNKSLYRANTYNMPLTPTDKHHLNEAAAETIEKLHLLKAYGIAPMVVPAESMQLPWDILVMPPLDKSLRAYDEGIVADFYCSSPNRERTDATLSITQDNHTQTNILKLGEDETHMRFRLHDNGQISFGLVHDNVPSTIAERIFKSHYAHDAFVRLRGLFIALAFDALVPDEIVREKVGGSVAAVLSRARRQTGQEPVLKLLLGRRRELNRQNISPASRQPRDWNAPRKDVDGYRRTLPEGTRARPQAEQEAREFYKSIGVKFDGLRPGENFVKGYARGTGPEKVTFRRAYFRNTSKTKRFLGDAGIRGS